MRVQSWHLGDARVTAVAEVDATSIISSIIPDATPERIAEVGWLLPDYTDDKGRLKGVVQSFLVEVDGLKIVVDSGIGNGKRREEMADWGNLETDFLELLAALGFDSGSVDIVVCTHLHFDHVGWNTVRLGRRWVPTFPRASYLFCAAEYEYWAGHPEAEIEDDHAGFVDSVQPIIDAGFATLVGSEHQVSPSVRLVPTFGHTPAHVSVQIDSRLARAVITGDAMHHPSQIAWPEWGTLSDTLPNEARASRRALLHSLAGTRTLLIGSHFPAPSAGTVTRSDSGFVFLPTRSAG